MFQVLLLFVQYYSAFFHLRSVGHQTHLQRDREGQRAEVAYSERKELILRLK